MKHFFVYSANWLIKQTKCVSVFSWKRQLQINEKKAFNKVNINIFVISRKFNIEFLRTASKRFGKVYHGKGHIVYL